jgi:MFS family permease
MRPDPLPAVHAARPLPTRWLVLSALVLSSFIGTWDVAAPVVAVPAITRQYNVGVDSAVWVLTIESLMFAVSMAVVGKLGDMYGRKRLYLISAGAFVLFTILAATARSFTWLIVCRALQGVSSSPGFTASMAYIGAEFPRAERGRAMAVQGISAGLGWTLGPILGGLMLLRFAWQSMIWIEIPLAALSFGLVLRLMPDDSRASRVPVDLIGAATLTASALVLILGLGQVSKAGWMGGPALALAGGFVALLVVFFVTEMRHPTPFVPLSLFADGRFSAAIAFSAITITIMLGVTLLVPLYLQEANGISPASAGLFLTGLSVARVLFAPAAGRVAEVHGPRLPSVAATGLLAVLTLGFVLWPPAPQTSGWLIFAAMFGVGLGIAFSQIPVNMAATYAAVPAQLGLAMGVFSMITYAAGSLGQTFFGALLPSLSGAGNAPLSAASRLDLLGAFRVSFAVITALAVLAGGIGLLLPGREMETSVESVAAGD